MTFATLGEYQRRRRRSIIWRFVQFALFVVTLLGTASYSYQVGLSASQTRADKLKADLERFQDDNLSLRDQLRIAAQHSGEAKEALTQLEKRYAADVPEGELKELLDQIELKIEAGVEPERLALLIDVADRPPACAGETETKRFMPKTPIDSGAVNAVRLGGNRVVVTGAGQSARNEAGLAEAWYDPGAPVSLTFRTLAGEAEDLAGTLPLRHVMVVDGTEYRFSAVAGERAFIEVTVQACPLPGLAPDEAEGESAPPAGAVATPLQG